nr:endonuclease domain-containing protein [candidate division Zixibacteria bacterium]
MMKREIIKYNPDLKKKARQLRNNSTASEKILWHYLKGKQRRGYDFHRQKPVDQFIIDFFCNELLLAIEIDGSSHEGKKIEDKIRQAKLESLGIEFLRFYDSDVKTNIEGVVVTIDNWILVHTPSSPAANPPLSRGD